MASRLHHGSPPVPGNELTQFRGLKKRHPFALKQGADLGEVMEVCLEPGAAVGGPPIAIGGVGRVQSVGRFPSVGHALAIPVFGSLSRSQLRSTAHLLREVDALVRAVRVAEAEVHVPDDHVLTIAEPHLMVGDGAAAAGGGLAGQGEAAHTLDLQGLLEPYGAARLEDHGPRRPGPDCPDDVPGRSVSVVRHRGHVIDVASPASSGEPPVALGAPEGGQADGFAVV